MEQQTVTREYMIKSTVPSLYRFISTPIGLAQWVCDSAKEHSPTSYALYWGKSESIITITSHKEGEFINYQWEDGNTLEMRIEKAELTNAISLVINESVEPEDVEDTCTLWDSNIKRLKNRLGTGE